MARCAVLASGNGSNFEAIARYIKKTDHEICCLICNKKDAFVFERASRHNIKNYLVSYKNRDKREAEEEILKILEYHRADLLVLAGFMKILSPAFIEAFSKKILNIHPSLLPKYPGMSAIERSFASGDRELGISIHEVDEGVDSGKILAQKSFQRNGSEDLEEIEKKIHKLEHELYPPIIVKQLDELSP